MVTGPQTSTRTSTPPPSATTAPTTGLTDAPLSPVPPSTAGAVGLGRVKWRQPLPSHRNDIDADADHGDDDGDVDGDGAAPPTLSGPSTLATWLAEGAHTITPYGQ